MDWAAALNCYLNIGSGDQINLAGQPPCFPQTPLTTTLTPQSSDPRFRRPLSSMTRSGLLRVRVAASFPLLPSQGVSVYEDELQNNFIRRFTDAGSSLDIVEVPAQQTF